MTYVIPHPTFVRYDNLESVLGFKYSRPHLIQLCKEGKFPQPYRLSANRVAWKIEELEAWKAERLPAEAQWPPRNPQGRPKRVMQ